MHNYTYDEIDELKAYIKRMEADVAFKDAKIRRLEGEIRVIRGEASWQNEKVCY